MDSLNKIETKQSSKLRNFPGGSVPKKAKVGLSVNNGGSISGSTCNISQPLPSKGKTNNSEYYDKLLNDLTN